MFKKFIGEYGVIKNTRIIPQVDLEKFKNNFPEELFQFISNGEGSYMDGFFWIVNPIEFNIIADEIYQPLSNPSICFGRDAFGGLYLWEDNSVIYVNVRYGKSQVIGRKVNILFNNIMTDWPYFSEELGLENYFPAKEKLGNLAFDECYGYVPLLGLGGPEKVENLEIVKLKELISIIAQALGKIN